MLQIVLNKYNYIDEYSDFGGIEGAIKIKKDSIDIDNFYNYQYIDDEIVLNPIPQDKPNDLIRPAYDGTKWVEDATEEDIRNFYLCELDIVNKINAEYVCGLVSKKEMDEVKIYIKSFKTRKRVVRPEIFRRY